jgi:hypothetical protein
MRELKYNGCSTVVAYISDGSKLRKGTVYYCDDCEAKRMKELLIAKLNKVSANLKTGAGFGSLFSHHNR